MQLKEDLKTKRSFQNLKVEADKQIFSTFKRSSTRLFTKRRTLNTVTNIENFYSRISDSDPCKQTYIKN